MNNKLRSIAAPVILGLIYISSLILLNAYSLNENNLFITIVSIVSVLIAHQISPSSPRSVGSTMLVLSIIFPILVMYLIGNHDNLKTPLTEVLGFIEWHLFLLPFIFSLSTSCVLKYLISHARVK